MSIDFGQVPSPCFVLDENLLIDNLKKLAYVQAEAGIDIILALKGYALWHTFPLVKQFLKGATASSLNEALLINEYMACKAHTYAPVYTDTDFENLVQLSTHISFNSLSQWERFKNKALNHPHISFGFRINPIYSEVGTALYNPGAFDSRLGVQAEELGTKLPEGISGLHFHLLCENDSHVLERTLRAVEEKFGHFLSQITWLNMGGGHLITKADYDINHLITLLKSFKIRYPSIKKIILEPGGAIAWRTGYLVSTVEDILVRGDIKIAMLDVSFAAHMPDCLEMPYKPQVLGATDAQEGKPRYRLGGNTCLSGDYIGMGDYSFEKELQIGDKVIFEDMIHYTMVKTTFFNGVTHPNIGIWTHDKKFTILREFDYADYKGKLS